MMERQGGHAWAVEADPHPVWLTRMTAEVESIPCRRRQPGTRDPDLARDRGTLGNDASITPA